MLNDTINNVILYTKDAIRMTSLGQYYSDSDVEKAIKSKIDSVSVKKLLNYEKTTIVDKSLILDERLLTCDIEYVKELFMSYGLYCLFSKNDKYDITSDIIASYFSSIAVYGREYVDVEALGTVNHSIIRHNIIFSQWFLTFHELLGEDNIAAMVYNTSSSTNFYDNLISLLNHMKVRNSFNKKDSIKLKSHLIKIDEKCDEVLTLNPRIKSILAVYKEKYKLIMQQFENKHSFSKYLDFQDDLERYNFDISRISKKFDIDTKNINFSSEEKKNLKDMFSVIDTYTDLSVDDYDRFYEKLSSSLKLMAGRLKDIESSIKSDNFLINSLLLSKFVLPLFKKYEISSDEFGNIRGEVKFKKYLKQ